MDHLLDETGRDLLARARTFRREIVDANAEAWERARTPPVDALRAAAEAGLLAIEVPMAQGGQGGDYLAKLAICEELSRSDMAFAFSMINTQNVAARLAVAGNPAHLEKYVPDLISGRRFGGTALSEPGAGSDFSGIQCAARKVDGGWVLNGEKGWITNAAIGDVFAVYAQSDPAAGWRGIACFLVDGRRDGFTRLAPYALMGGHAIGVGGFRLENYFVADEDVLGLPGVAFKYAMAGVNGARAYVAAMCAGMISASLDLALDYGRLRRTFGKRLIEHQGLTWSLVDVATQLAALRGLTEKAGLAIARSGDAILPAAYAKKYAGDITVPAITACIQAMGANGLRAEHPLGRHLACAKIAAYTDGSTEIMKERIAAELIKSGQ